MTLYHKVVSVEVRVVYVCVGQGGRQGIEQENKQEPESVQKKAKELLRHKMKTAPQR